jgi:hypothetical protein
VENVGEFAIEWHLACDMKIVKFFMVFLMDQMQDILVCTIGLKG